MSKKDNVIQFPNKAVPETVTVSFGDSDPITYTLSSDNIDLSGIDTVTVTVPIDPVEMLEDEMVRQIELDLDED